MLFAVMVHRLGKGPRTEIVHVYTSWSCIIIKNYKRRYPGNVAINHKEQFRSHSKGEMRNEQRQNKFHISNHGSKVRMNITNLTCHPYDAQYFFPADRASSPFVCTSVISNYIYSVMFCHDLFLTFLSMLCVVSVAFI